MDRQALQCDAKDCCGRRMGAEKGCATLVGRKIRNVEDVTQKKGAKWLSLASWLLPARARLVSRVHSSERQKYWDNTRILPRTFTHDWTILLSFLWDPRDRSFFLANSCSQVSCRQQQIVLRRVLAIFIACISVVLAASGACKSPSLLSFYVELQHGQR